MNFLMPKSDFETFLAASVKARIPETFENMSNIRSTSVPVSCCEKQLMTIFLFYQLKFKKMTQHDYVQNPATAAQVAAVK